MSVRVLRDRPSPELARALAEFESEFAYPLGPGRTFRISHGDDYPRFFRAIGDAACFVAESRGRVAGTLGIAVHPIQLPDGGERNIIYAGDLKVSRSFRTGFTYLQLAWAAEPWLRTRADAGYCVVMDGTAATPPAYTGAAGIPGAVALTKLAVLRVPCPEGPRPGDERFRADGALALAAYRDISRGRYACLGGDPEARSEMPPTWLLAPDGLACGRVEDTRRAKRLVGDDGAELVSGHLACFAARSPEAGAELVRTAGRVAAASGLPALFVAVAAADAPDLVRALGVDGVVDAPATVYGIGLPAGPAWNVNSSEI